MVAQMSLVALNQDNDIEAKAAGRIVWWTLSGDVNRDALALALAGEGSAFEAPPEPSPKVAITRAAHEVAKAMRGDAHQTKQGAWCIVGKASKEDGGATLAYPINLEAVLGADYRPVVTGDDPAAFLAAFDAARASLASIDVGNWLCDVLTRVGAVALRERGGIYFVPRDAVAKWERVTRALASASGHKIHAMPAMRTADAVDAILSAITADTERQCDETNAEIRGDDEHKPLGKRGLANRHQEMQGLLERLARYEDILGTRLDGLRTGIENVRASLSAAILDLECGE